jgi:4-coumarate--CoA ligase (photoactive yellow protein activation family)
VIELGGHREQELAAFGGSGMRTAGQLAGLAAAIAKKLEGHASGSRVVLACEDRYYFSAGLLALWQRGLVALLPSNGQADTVRALAHAPGVAGLLHDRQGDVGLDVRTLELSAGTGHLPVRVTMPRQSTAVIAYTSGSTGQPTAHEKTLAQLIDEPLALIEAFDLAKKRVLASVPPHHLYGLLFGVLVPLLGGGATSRTSPLQPAEVLRELAAHDAQVLVAVPPHLSALAQALREGAGFRAGTRVFSSGAPLSQATDSMLREQGVEVTQVLGSTETGGIAHRRKAGDEPWQLLPGVRIAVEGELLSVASPWSSPEAMATVRTSDRVELVAGGFRHLGRADQVVKIGGRRVELGDVESKLRAVAGVRDARVLTLESGSLRGLELCAVVEVDEAAGLTAQTLRQALGRTLDPVTLPRRYRLVSRLPRTAAGKVDMDTLRTLFDVWELPRTELEGGKLRFELPANYGYFRGHFDGNPILPGVVQLEQIALRVARERFPGLGALARLTRVKFKRPISPGEQLVLGIDLKNGSQVHFELRCNDAPAASGILHFRSTAP